MSNMHNYSQQVISSQDPSSPVEEAELQTEESEFDAMLIKKVKNYPELYNKKKNKDPDAETLAWCTVADELNSTVPICQKRLQRLREYYSRERQNRETGERKKKFELYEMMNFMGPFIYRRKKNRAIKRVSQSNDQQSASNVSFTDPEYYTIKNSRYSVSESQDDADLSPVKTTLVYSVSDFVAVDLDGNISYMEEDLCEEYKLGKLIIEGKTKKVYEYPSDPKLCYLESKDRITAGDGAKSHELEGKAAISNITNAKVFELLNQAGIKTAFVKLASDKAFFSRRCEMVPIEWITRRLATGSFLKRNPGVHEGYRFNPPLQETCFKDDENHDPLWSDAQIISAGWKLNGVTIRRDEYEIMKRTALTVFEVLERFWATRDCALIDMKIEFGIDIDGEILVADIIDSDSWRLWPSGDKRLMKDKQVYRNLSTVTQSDLETVKRNFIWVADQIKEPVPVPSALVVILMGSPSDEEHCKKIAKHCSVLGLVPEIRVSSAHKGTEETLRILADYEGTGRQVVLVAVAGRSNGLGPVLSGNTAFPVINCPPGTLEEISQDIWSSLKVPSGLGCTTVVYPESAALAAAQIHALHDHFVWARLRVKQLNTFVALKKADKNLKKTSF